MRRQRSEGSTLPGRFRRPYPEFRTWDPLCPCFRAVVPESNAVKDPIVRLSGDALSDPVQGCLRAPVE
jgi:hypothetical protein